MAWTVVIQAPDAGVGSHWTIHSIWVWVCGHVRSMGELYMVHLYKEDTSDKIGIGHIFWIVEEST